MRRTAVVVMTVATVFPGQAEQAAGNDRTVVVHIANEHVAMEALAFAKPQATQMFAKIGIRLQWRGTGHAPLPQNAIAVEMVEQAFTTSAWARWHAQNLTKERTSVSFMTVYKRRSARISFRRY